MFPWCNNPTAPPTFNWLRVPKGQAVPSFAPLFPVSPRTHLHRYFDASYPATPLFRCVATLRFPVACFLISLALSFSFVRLSLSTAPNFDADISVGSDIVAVTGNEKVSVGVDITYTLYDVNTLYETYAMTDEKLTGVGVQSVSSSHPRQHGSPGRQTFSAHRSRLHS